MLIFVTLSLPFQYSCEKKPIFETKGNASMISIIGNIPDCDLQKSDCSFQLPDGSVYNINFSVRPVIPNRLTDIYLKGKDISYHPFAIDFDGAKMRMGFNRPNLEKIELDINHGRFTLPTCSTRTFQWKTIILFRDNKNKISGVPFHFEVTKK